MNKIIKSAIGFYREREKDKGGAFNHARIILKSSKKAISRLHYEDFKTAEALLAEASESFKVLGKTIAKNKKIKYEGFVREGLEEFVEASLYLNFLKYSKPDLPKKVIDFISDDPDILIGGLCDFTGEATRRAVRIASKERMGELTAISETVNLIIEGLLEIDLSGYVRTKFDQAKRNAHKLEMMIYEIRIRS